MHFRFSTHDFSLSDGKKANSRRLRYRFLKLYKELTPMLRHDPTLRDFVSDRGESYNLLTTRSPYVPKYNRWGGGYRAGCWIGFAEREYTDPRTGVQFQFGIKKNRVFCYGIWIEGTSEARRSSKKLSEILAKDPAKVAERLRGLGADYKLEAWTSDDTEVISCHVNSLGAKKIEGLISELQRRGLYIHLGKSMTRKQLCAIKNVSLDIIGVVHHLMPTYLWWSDLSPMPPRTLTMEETLKLLRSGKQKAITEAFDDSTGEREIIVSQRIGQDAVRKNALERYGAQCALCDISEPELLRAGHIIRWADDPKNRGNTKNVICLCVAHDQFFEKGLISLRDDYTTIYKSKLLSLCAKSKMLAAVKSNTATGLRPPSSGAPDPKFLKKHRRRFNYTEEEMNN